MVPTKALSLLIPAPILFLAGCSVLIPWNPVVNGLELDKKVSFNYADIGIEIKSLAFWNGMWNPQVRLEIANFSPDTLRFSRSGFKLYIGSDTITQKTTPTTEEILSPDERVKLELHYDYMFRESRIIHIGDRELDVPQPTSLHFAFPTFHAKDTTIAVPAIEYVNPIRKSLGTQFVLDDGHTASPAAK